MDQKEYSELLGPVERVFGRSVARYGSRPKAVAWRDGKRQIKRFSIFSQLFSLTSEDTRFIVNDLGCGYGALFIYLKNLPEFNKSSYFGYDISSDMITEAKKNLTDPRATWIRSHIATEPGDFSFASGTYNMLMNADEDRWREYVEDNLMQLWSKTRLALCFNMLSNKSPRRQKTLYYADQDHFTQFCKNNMEAKVMMSDVLSPEEFVIFVVRKQVSEKEN